MEEIDLRDFTPFLCRLEDTNEIPSGFTWFFNYSLFFYGHTSVRPRIDYTDIKKVVELAVAEMQLKDRHCDLGFDVVDAYLLRVK